MSKRSSSAIVNVVPVPTQKIKPAESVQAENDGGADLDMVSEIWSVAELYGKEGVTDKDTRWRSRPCPEMQHFGNYLAMLERGMDIAADFAGKVKREEFCKSDVGLALSRLADGILCEGGSYPVLEAAIQGERGALQSAVYSTIAHFPHGCDLGYALIALGWENLSDFLKAVQKRGADWRKPQGTFRRLVLMCSAAAINGGLSSARIVDRITSPKVSPPAVPGKPSNLSRGAVVPDDDVQESLRGLWRDWRKKCDIEWGGAIPRQFGFPTLAELRKNGREDNVNVRLRDPGTGSRRAALPKKAGKAALKSAS